MEENQNKKIKKQEFVYNPEALDICDFAVVVDHLHWKLLCKQAQDLSTTTGHLLALILERYLIKTGYLDPNAPASTGLSVSVTLREARDEPDNLFSFYAANVFEDNKETKPATAQIKKPKDSESFDDDDDTEEDDEDLDFGQFL